VLPIIKNTPLDLTDFNVNFIQQKVRSRIFTFQGKAGGGRLF